MISGVGHFVGEAHAAFAGTEWKGDGQFIFAFINRSLHYGHAGASQAEA